jgi:ABC-type thiamin/hydroxymethylpyrimidine transport system permease subunit
MPRIIFPNKAPLPSDTDIMAKYSGLRNVWDANTSISLGYLAELYVDFGIIGAVFAAGIIGALIGAACRYLQSRKHASVLLVAGVCIIPSLAIGYFGQAYAKFIGSFVFALAVAVFVQVAVIPGLYSKLGGLRASQRRIAATGDGPR